MLKWPNKISLDLSYFWTEKKKTKKNAEETRRGCYHSNVPRVSPWRWSGLWTNWAAEVAQGGSTGSLRSHTEGSVLCKNCTMFTQCLCISGREYILYVCKIKGSHTLACVSHRQIQQQRIEQRREDQVGCWEAEMDGFRPFFYTRALLIRLLGSHWPMAVVYCAATPHL